MKSLSSRIALLATLGVAVTLLAAAATPSYKVLNTYKVGGEGGWDYLTADPNTHNVFISRGNHVMVINGDTGQPVGDIPGTDGIHGIALADSLNKGFTSNGRSNDVTVFDLKSLKETGKVKLEGAQNPDAILYDPATKRVFTFNGRTSNATAIDATNDTVIGNITLDGKPETAASDGKGMVFVNIEDKSEIQQIDARNNKVVNTWSIKPCEEPSGLAMDQKNRRLFAGCHNKIMAVVNADNGKVVATPAIGAGVDANGWDPERKLAFSSNGDGTLTIVHQDGGDQYSVAQDLKTEPRARTMTVDTKNHRVYLVTADFQAPPPQAEAPAGAPAGQPAQRPRPTMVPGSFRVIVVGSE
ncbi:MAG: YncE family protein [Acidobacteria bacterium]|nr:YncE family protein [Acidobacteriota bacterium]